MTGTWWVTVDEQRAECSGWDEISSLIAKVGDGSGEFFVVEREPDSDEFIQASVWTTGLILGKSYVAEVLEPTGSGKVMWSLKTKRFEEIESAVEAYIVGEFEAGPRWTDVTDEVLEDE